MSGISCNRFGLCFPLVAVPAVLIFVMAARAAEKEAGDAADKAPADTARKENDSKKESGTDSKAHPAAKKAKKR